MRVLFCFAALLDDAFMADTNAPNDDDDDCSSSTEAVPPTPYVARHMSYMPLSPDEDDDDGKNTVNCLINAIYNCYT